MGEGSIYEILGCFCRRDVDSLNDILTSLDHWETEMGYKMLSLVIQLLSTLINHSKYRRKTRGQEAVQRGSEQSCTEPSVDLWHLEHWHQVTGNLECRRHIRVWKHSEKPKTSMEQ